MSKEQARILERKPPTTENLCPESVALMRDTLAYIAEEYHDEIHPGGGACRSVFYEIFTAALNIDYPKHDDSGAA